MRLSDLFPGRFHSQQPTANSQGQHFVNPLSSLATPLLPQQSGSSSGSSPASSLLQLGEGVAKKLRGVGQAAAPHLVAIQKRTQEIQKSAQAQFKTALDALDDATFSKLKQVGAGFKNVTPSQIANDVFMELGIGRNESISVLKNYI